MTLFILPLLIVFVATAQHVAARATADLQVKKLKVNDVELAYVEEGDGQTVVFVHGGGVGDWRSWEVLRPYVSQRYRYVSLSRRYHHPNPWMDDGRKYTMAQHVEDVAAFIRNLNAGKVHLVGNSYGGGVVARVALKYPDLLRSAAFGESLIASTSGEAKTAMAAAEEYRAKVAAAATRGDFRKAAVLQYENSVAETGGFAKLPAERQKQLVYNARTLAVEARPGTPLTCDELGTLAVPSLLIRGENTNAAPRYGYERTLECLPTTAEAVVIPGAPHSWQIGNPEASATAILTFIAKH